MYPTQLIGSSPAHYPYHQQYGAVCRSNSGPQDLFRNANKGEFNKNYCNSNSAVGGGIQLSAKAQMMMSMLSMMNSLMSGGFGQMMNMLGGLPSQANQGGQMQNFSLGDAGFARFQKQNAAEAEQRSSQMKALASQMAAGRTNGSSQMQGMPICNPGFGQSRGACANQGANQTSSVNGANATQVAPGQVKELKAGETVRGANGTVLKWGENGNVDMSYQDKNGQTKNVQVKNGMISFDGGPPQKLENVGQILKLPNGDVVGIGNNPNSGDGKPVRVVMADNVDNIKTEPASATNIYQVDEMQRRQTTMEGGGVSVNMNAGSFHSSFGETHYANASVNVFLGHPVTRCFSELMMKLVGSK